MFLPKNQEDPVPFHANEFLLLFKWQSFGGLIILLIMWICVIFFHIGSLFDEYVYFLLALL